VATDASSIPQPKTKNQKPRTENPPFVVHFVGAGPGDPDLLTRKAERLLRNCRCCIWAGSLVNPAILDLLPPGAERHDSSGMTLDQIVDVIVRCRDRGFDVVRLHTGEPSLFGAIGEQMARLDRLGIAYEVVPGVSSFQAAAAALRCELTAPEVAQTVVLTRAPGRTSVPAAHTLDRLAPLQATLCIFLSTDRIGEVAAALAPHYGPDCPAALVYHASWPDEQVLRGTLADIAGRVRQAGHTRTGMVLVGRALAGTAAESRLYAADFGHGYRRPGSSGAGDGA
jgi:precorrin-4/cobalt-precorrin-4 C11-methyltransferase